MKIVQSFWSGNTTDINKNYGWISSKYHLLSWILSCNQLKKYYSEVELVTDEFGYNLLIEKLKLPYSKVHVVLDELNTYNENLWALAKIKTYKLMNEPFLHIDGDVFIWEKFDQNLLSSGLIIQNIETTTEYYRTMWSNIFPNLEYLPKSMNLFNNGNHNKAYNMGIFGGNDIEFIQKYCDESFAFVNNNTSKIDKIDPFNFNIFFEQVLFYEMAYGENKKVATLINEDIGDNEYEGFGNFDEVPNNRKYLHLLGFFKRQHNISVKLETYVLKFYPEFYKLLEELLNVEIKLSSFNYNYSLESNNQLETEYYNNLILGENQNSLKQLISRNLFMQDKLQSYYDLKENNTKFIVLKNTNFEIKDVNNDGQNYLEIQETDNNNLFIPLINIDEIIFEEIDGISNDFEFEKKTLEYLSEDFPVEEYPTFLKTIWERVSYFISLRVLVAIDYEEFNNYKSKILKT